jgi:hypothetical protein
MLSAILVNPKLIASAKNRGQQGECDLLKLLGF